MEKTVTETAHVRFAISDADGDETTVAIAGELDISNLPMLADEVETALERKPQRLVVDVSEVRFADSSAISLWLKWAMAVPQFELRNPPTMLRAVIKSMGLNAPLGMAI